MKYAGDLETASFCCWRRALALLSAESRKLLTFLAAFAPDGYKICVKILRLRREQLMLACWYCGSGQSTVRIR